MNLIIKERRLRWLGHVLRLEDDRILKEVTVLANGPPRQAQTRKTEEKLD